MRILVTGRLPESVLALLERHHQVAMNPEDRPMAHDQLLAQIGTADGLLCMITDSIDGEVLSQAPRLKAIANHAVGFDNIDLAAATQMKIPVSNTPGVLTDATADLTFALILATARRVVEGDGRTRSGRFRYWAPRLFLGQEVSGKVIGIIGLGRIGRAVARRAAGFSMPILYHQRHRLNPAEEAELDVAFASLPELLESADFVTIHVPLTAQTHHLIDRTQLEQMKPSAILINTARGPVVNERALLHALQTGGIHGAGLDVYENEPDLTPGLAEQTNAVLLPHVGSATVETRTRMADKAARNLLAALAGRRPPDCLNWTDIYANH